MDFGKVWNGVERLAQAVARAIFIPQMEFCQAPPGLPERLKVRRHRYVRQAAHEAGLVLVPVARMVQQAVRVIEYVTAGYGAVIVVPPERLDGLFRDVVVPST